MTETPRDAGHWAKPVSRLHVDIEHEHAPNLVEGKRLLSPLQGFGKMWQKTYRVRLDGVALSPAEVVAVWKERFAELWPEGNTFYPSRNGMQPGEVGLIRAAGPAGLKLSTGVMVMHADEVSFTEMTPEGHMLAGWVTFSAHEQDGVTVAQAQLLIRAQDPLAEIGLAFGGHRMEDRFWEQVLANLATHLGAPADVETQVVCVDRKRQWSKAGNIRHSVAIRSTLYALRPRRRRRRTDR
jgi:hypothetical protein